MPSSWDVYYVVFLSALLALVIPLSLGAAAAAFTPRREKKSNKKPHALPSPNDHTIGLGQRINTRFFMGANAALLLIAMVLILIPCVATLSLAAGKAETLRGLLSVISIAAIIFLGLFYSSVKGDLSWLSSYRKDDKK